MLKAVYIEMPPSHPLAWPAGRQRPKAGDGGCVCGWVGALYNPHTRTTPSPTPACASVCRKKIYSLRCSSPNRKFKCLHFAHQTNCSSRTHPPPSYLHTHLQIHIDTRRTKEQRFTYVCLLRISNYIRHRSDSSSKWVDRGNH